MNPSDAGIPNEEFLITIYEPLPVDVRLDIANPIPMDLRVPEDKPTACQ